MTKIVNIPPRDRGDIESQARAWLVRLDGGRPKHGELLEFRQWLARSPLHRECFDAAARTWSDLDGLSLWLNDRPGQPRARRRRMTSGRAVAVAACVVTLAVTVAWLTTSPRWQPRYSEAFVTSIGEVRSVPLPDGSRMQLNTATRISTAMDDRARMVRLDAGEAWFQVAPDPDTPFVVYAGNVAVQAIGTAFSVRREGDGVDLTVTEGRVELAALTRPVPATTELEFRAIDATTSRVPLEQGQQAVYDGGIESIRRIDPPEIERTLSWRDGMLVFDDDRLEDVVAEINRYTPQKIVISDSELQEVRFGGYFRVGDVSSILATFEDGFGIRVARVNDGLIYLSRRPDDH